MHEAMGGYFELELARGHHPFPHAHAYNSARSAFQAILQARRSRRVFMPFYLCSVMHDAARSAGVEVVNYHLTQSLELQRLPSLNAEDALLYVDYFGLKTHYIKSTLVERYRKGLIVDNSQAFFSAPVDGIASLYSPRKFVGVPDGGLLLNAPSTLDRPTAEKSVSRFDALLGRLSDGPEAYYSDFLQGEHSLGVEGVRGMSRATYRLLDSIDYASVRNRRIENFSHLHNALSLFNTASWIPGEPCAALCYPLMMKDAAQALGLRDALRRERIFVPCYWREVLDDAASPALERDMCGRLLPLPIDQRYGTDELDRMTALIRTYFATQIGPR